MSIVRKQIIDVEMAKQDIFGQCFYYVNCQTKLDAIYF